MKSYINCVDRVATEYSAVLRPVIASIESLGCRVQFVFKVEIRICEYESVKTVPHLHCLLFENAAHVGAAVCYSWT